MDQSSAKNILLCKISCSTLALSDLDSLCSDKVPVITRSVCIGEDLSWKVTVHGKVLEQSACSGISNFPKQINYGSLLQELLTKVNELHVCAGNPDKNFLSLMDRRKEKIKNGTCESAFIDSFFPVFVDGESCERTVRTTKCEMLVCEHKCDSCKAYRATLRALASREKSQAETTPTKRTGASSHFNFRYLSTPDKSARLTSCSTRAKLALKDVEKLRKKIEFLTERDGMQLSGILEEDFATLFSEGVETVKKMHSSGTFEQLFWDQQAEALKSGKRQVRWHPMMIKWCLNLKLMSSSAYSALRTSGALTLPSERTLRDYTHFIKPDVGFSNEVDLQLLKEARLESARKTKQYVCLIFDEVKVKENLVYDKHSGEMIGFTDIGDINNCLEEFRRDCEENRQKPQLATHMLVFMVSGIVSKLNYPYAQFPCTSLSADHLYSLVWGCVRRLEGIGFKVLATTCDGASCNRKFFKLHGDIGELVYKTDNPYSNESRPLFFLSDAPHLIKTTRNCWANSFAHSKSRSLWVRVITDSYIRLF